METEEYTTIHLSLSRPNLLMGCDRELVLFAALVAVVLMFALMTWWSIPLGFFVWVGSMWGLSRMAKNDPLMRQVYLRSVKYRSYYPAKSRLWARGTKIPRSWK